MNWFRCSPTWWARLHGVGLSMVPLVKRNSWRTHSLRFFLRLRLALGLEQRLPVPRRELDLRLALGLEQRLPVPRRELDLRLALGLEQRLPVPRRELDLRLALGLEQRPLVLVREQSLCRVLRAWPHWRSTPWLWTSCECCRNSARSTVSIDSARKPLDDRSTSQCCSAFGGCSRANRKPMPSRAVPGRCILSRGMFCGASAIGCCSRRHRRSITQPLPPPWGRGSITAPAESGWRLRVLSSSDRHAGADPDSADRVGMRVDLPLVAARPERTLRLVLRRWRPGDRWAGEPVEDPSERQSGTRKGTRPGAKKGTRKGTQKESSLGEFFRQQGCPPEERFLRPLLVSEPGQVLAVYPHHRACWPGDAPLGDAPLGDASSGGFVVKAEWQIDRWWSVRRMGVSSVPSQRSFAGTRRCFGARRGGG